MWFKKKCFYLLIVLLNSYFTDAQLKTGNNRGQCSIEGLQNVDWDILPLRIPDNAQGIIKSFVDKDTVKSVTPQYDNNCEDCMGIYYLEDNKTINIKLLQEFLKYEEKLPSVFTLNTKIKLECQGESQLDVRIDLDDINDYPPEFLQIKDTVTLPMPIASNVNIGELNSDFKITVRDIDFKNKGIDFKIEPDEYFEVSTTTNDQCGEVLPNRKVYTALIKTKKKMYINKDYKIKITATDKPSMPNDPPRSVSREITIKVDEQNSVLPTPVFKQPLYKGLYETETGVFNMINEPIQLKEIYKQQKSHLVAENSLFNDAFTLNEKDLSIKLNHKLEEDQIKNLNYIILYVITNFISENSEETTEGKTVVLIDLKKPEPTTTTSTTEKTTESSGTTITTSCPEITCPPCETTTVTSFTCPTTTIPENITTCAPCSSTEETTSNHFTTESNTCPTCPPCSTESSSITCTPCATTYEPCPTTCEPCECNSTQSTTIPCDCPSTTINTSPSVCPTSVPCDCPTTTIKPGTYLKYSQDEYRFDETDDFHGLIKKIEATSSDKYETILYNFDINEPSIKSSISYGPDDPELKINAKIPSGEYNIILHATGQTTNNKAKTNVILKIFSEQTCNEDDKYKFTDKLVIKNAMENHDKDNLFVLNQPDEYKLEIISTYPPEFARAFSINETDESLSMKAVDREDKIFNDFLVAQIQVKIQAKNKTNENIFKREAIPSSRGWILTDNIDNESDKMILNIIIDDENDNHPEFQDVKNPLVLGYPSSEFSNIAPPYLVKVTATDKDIGDNGRVTYSISGNDKFIVNSNEGIVTLTKNAFMDDITEEFMITASDHGEKPLKSYLKVKVILLQKEHISVITVDGLLYDNIDKFFDDLNSKSKGTNFGYVSASTVLSIDNKQKKIKNKNNVFYRDEPKDSKTQLRIVIYALKDEVPQKTEDIKGIIEENVKNIDVENIQDSPLNCEPKTTSCDETGWIVAVSILSLAFVAAIIAIIVIYFKYIRDMPDLILETKPPSPSTFEKNTISTTSETKKESSISTRRATGFPKDFDPKLLEEDDEDDEDGVKNKEEDKEQNEIIINNNINPISDLHTDKGVDNLGFEPDDLDSGNKEPKKENDGKAEKRKVVFNEEVEEIHITVL